MPAWIFGAQIADFSKHYRVIAFDPRAQGESELAADGYEPNRRAQDIAELIRATGVEPVLLVGWSLGVLDSLAYVHTHGDSRIAGLVLIDNSVGEDPPPVASRHRAQRRRPASREVRMRAFVRGMFVHPPPAAWLDRLTTECLRTPEPAAEALLSYPEPRSYWKEAVYSTDRPVLYVVTPRLAGQAANLQLHRAERRGGGDARRRARTVRRRSARLRRPGREFHPAPRLAVIARAAALAPLFLVSAAALGFEIALTRYFAVAKWSEYGYWVISIVLAGFALSGVVLALARDWFVRHGPAWLAGLPAALIVAGAVGYHLATVNPFNPLQLQNPTTVAPQLLDIAGYYAALLPFFSLAGLFVGLSFVLNPTRLGPVYGADLTGRGGGGGAGAGADGVCAPVPADRRAAAAAGAGGGLRAAAARGAAGGTRGAAGGGGAAAARRPRRLQRFQGDLRAAAHRGQPGAGRAHLAARPVPAARRFHRAGGHRRLQQRRHAQHPRPADDLRPVSRRQPHRRPAAPARRGRRTTRRRRWARCPTCCGRMRACC